MNLSKYTKKIDGEKIYLNILSEKDASQEYCDWLNDEVVNKYLETRQSNMESLRQYISNKFEADDCLFFGIFWKENNKHIGNIKLEPIDFATKKATLGILIGDKNFWGKGLGTEAVNLVTNYAFNELEIDEVNLGVLSDNKPAVKMYEKCGFTTFKVDKEYMNHNGVLYDQVWMKKMRV